MARRSISPAPPSGARLAETLMGGWRPLARVDVAGFALLRSRGITRRANSALALDLPADGPALAAAVNRVERLCAAAGDAPVFRVVQGDEQDALDALLASRGYTMGPQCDLLALPLTASTAAPAPSPEVRIETGPLPEDWFAESWRLSPRSGEGARETLHDILAGSPAVHASVTGTGGQVLAVGRAALVDTGRARTAVVNCVATDADHRRQGMADAVMRSLLSVAASAGAGQALLEVETDNPGALRLYRRLGFTRFAGYHYRIAP